MTWFDHALTATILAVAPASAVWNMARFVRAVESGRPGARLHGYLWTMASQWGVTLTLLIYWTRQPRALDALGLVWPAGAALWISVFVSVAAIAFMARQTLAAAASAESQAKMREQLAGKVAVFTLLPRTSGEVRAFTALGVTAGICEEILYRGFLLWYAAHFADRPVAAIVAVLAFGLSHAYQGMTGVIQAVVFAAIAVALYLLTGSLLAPMVLHAALDVGSGRTARHALSSL